MPEARSSRSSCSYTSLRSTPCIPPTSEAPLAGGHPEFKAYLLPGCQPASSCSKPYALRLPTDTEVQFAEGRVEVKAASCRSTSPRSRRTPQHACRGASKDPVAPACSLQRQRPPEDQGVACLRQGASPRSSLRRRQCPPTTRVTAQDPSVREDRKDSLAFFGLTDLHATCRGPGGQGVPAAVQTTLRPTCRGKVNKIFMQLYLLPYGLRLACRLLRRSRH